MEYLIKKLKKEDGVTLVELLAAIAILSIITTAFLAFFTQAGRTNNMTDDINEATFIAVEEMERVTNLSQKGNSLGVVHEVYTGEKARETVTSIKKTINHEEYKASLEIKKNNGTNQLPGNLYHVSVPVSKGGRTHAEMQSVLPFEEQVI